MHPRCGWLTSLLPLMHALTWRVRACRNSLVFHSLDKVAAHWAPLVSLPHCMCCTYKAAAAMPLHASVSARAAEQSIRGRSIAGLPHNAYGRELDCYTVGRLDFVMSVREHKSCSHTAGSMLAFDVAGHTGCTSQDQRLTAAGGVRGDR